MPRRSTMLCAVLALVLVASLPAAGAQRRLGRMRGGAASYQTAPERAYTLFLSPYGDDVYYQAVRVLIYWLKQDPLRCSCYPVVVLASEHVAPEKLHQLMLDGALIKRVTIPQIELNKADVSADRWAATMGKLHAFNLTEFQQVVFIDGDFVLLEAVDPVFNYGEEHFDVNSLFVSAVPNSWGDTWDAMRGVTNREFNSGFMLLHPDEAHFHKMLELGHANQGKFLMDQQLLNQYFRLDGPFPWRPLPPRYNRQFVRSMVDLQTDTVCVHEKAFWHHGAEEVWQIWEAGKAALASWDLQVSMLVKMRKYELTDIAYRLQTGQMCSRRCGGVVQQYHGMTPLN